MRELLDVMNQTVQLPLRIDFLLPSQGKAVQLFVVPQIAKLNCAVFRIGFNS
jgi:hypothetical protein